MGTVIALASRGGVAIAGDKQADKAATVTSQTVQRVFEIEPAGVGVVGETTAIQTFQRLVKADLRQHRLQTDGEVEFDAITTVVARLIDRLNLTGVIAGYDAAGTARLHEIDSNGGVFDQSAVALGTGAELAAGRLAAVRSGRDIDGLETTVTAVLDTVANRDVTSGETVDLWSVSRAPSRHSS